MKTKVINVNSKELFEIFIGRRKNNKHFGNPFVMQQTKDRPMVIEKFERWLRGDPEFSEVEPERRQWILDHLEELRGKTLGCYCSPKPCHGDIYIKLLEEK